MIPADELFGSSDDADLLLGEPKGSIEPVQPQHPGAVALNTIEQALAQLRAGRPIDGVQGDSPRMLRLH